MLVATFNFCFSYFSLHFNILRILANKIVNSILECTNPKFHKEIREFHKKNSKT